MSSPAIPNFDDFAKTVKVSGQIPAFDDWKPEDKPNSNQTAETLKNQGFFDSYLENLKGLIKAPLEMITPHSKAQKMAQIQEAVDNAGKYLHGTPQEQAAARDKMIAAVPMGSTAIKVREGNYGGAAGDVAAMGTIGALVHGVDSGAVADAGAAIKGGVGAITPEIRVTPSGIRPSLGLSNVAEGARRAVDLRRAAAARVANPEAMDPGVTVQQPVAQPPVQRVPLSAQPANIPNVQPPPGAAPSPGGTYQGVRLPSGRVVGPVRPSVPPEVDPGVTVERVPADQLPVAPRNPTHPPLYDEIARALTRGEQGYADLTPEGQASVEKIANGAPAESAAVKRSTGPIDQGPKVELGPTIQERLQSEMAAKRAAQTPPVNNPAPPPVNSSSPPVESAPAKPAKVADAERALFEEMQKSGSIPESAKAGEPIAQVAEGEPKPTIPVDTYKGMARGRRADTAGTLAEHLAQRFDDIGKVTAKDWQDASDQLQIDWPKTTPAMEKLINETVQAFRKLKGSAK